MASGQPLDRLVLSASSVLEDLAFVALADISRALQGVAGADYRVIGGLMVTALAARWGLGADLYRETGDVDLGITPVVARTAGVVSRLHDIGYTKVSGNRFSRPVHDVPVTLDVGAPPHEAVIDILVPAYTSRARTSIRVADDLVTTEVLGLASALARPPVTVELTLHRLNGHALSAELAFPEELSALVLKGLARRARLEPNDVVDIWRCLEICYAAGVHPDDAIGQDSTDCRDIVRSLFSDRHGPGMADLIAEQRLAENAADERFTRIQALLASVPGT